MHVRAGLALQLPVHQGPDPQYALGNSLTPWLLGNTVAQATVSDRFYRALYAVLGSDGPATSSKAPMFLALLYKVGGHVRLQGLSRGHCCARHARVHGSQSTWQGCGRREQKVCRGGQLPA